MGNPGRPTIFTAEIATEVCSRLAEGESLRSICKDDHLPDRATIVDWVLKDRNGFARQYTQARELGLDTVADEVFEISDDGSNDWMEKFDKDGKAIGWQINGEALGRSRLRFDARRWYLSKLAPKRYGERVAIDATIDDVTELSATQRAAKLAALTLKLSSRAAGEEAESFEDLA